MNRRQSVHGYIISSFSFYPIENLNILADVQFLSVALYLQVNSLSYQHCLFMHDALTCMFDVTFLLSWESVYNDNFIVTEQHSHARCTSTQLRPLRQNSIYCEEVCGIQRGRYVHICKQKGEESEIWLTIPFSINVHFQ